MTQNVVPQEKQVTETHSQSTPSVQDISLPLQSTANADKPSSNQSIITQDNHNVPIQASGVERKPFAVPAAPFASNKQSNIDNELDEDEENDDDMPAFPSNDPARTGHADPTPAIKALEKHILALGRTRDNSAAADSTVPTESQPVRARRSRPDVWTCFLGCGQKYRKSSGRSIRRHVISCFRDLYPSETAALTDSQLNDLLATHQETGSIDTGLRTWRLRQQRRNAGDLPINERWQCPHNCGRCYRATSVKSIQKHLQTCLGPQTSIASMGVPLRANIPAGVPVANVDYGTQVLRALPAVIPATAMVGTPVNSHQSIDWHSLSQPINVAVAQSVVQGINRQNYPITASSVSPLSSVSPFVIVNSGMNTGGLDAYHQVQFVQQFAQPITQATPYLAQAIQTQDSTQQQQTSQQPQFRFQWANNQ